MRKPLLQSSIQSSDSQTNKRKLINHYKTRLYAHAESDATREGSFNGFRTTELLQVLCKTRKYHSEAEKRAADDYSVALRDRVLVEINRTLDSDFSDALCGLGGDWSCMDIEALAYLAEFMFNVNYFAWSSLASTPEVIANGLGGGCGDCGEFIIILIFIAAALGMALVTVNEVGVAAQDSKDVGSVQRLTAIALPSIISGAAAGYFVAIILPTIVTGVASGGVVPIAVGAFFAISLTAMVVAFASRKLYDACSDTYKLSSSERLNLQSHGHDVFRIQKSIDNKKSQLDKIGYFDQSIFSGDDKARTLKQQIASLKKCGTSYPRKT